MRSATSQVGSGIVEGRARNVFQRLGEQTLGAGMCAGYPAAKRDAHHFVNRGTAPAVYLEVGNRIDGDNAFYPDDDLLWCNAGDGEYAAHKDGRRYPD